MLRRAYMQAMGIQVWEARAQPSRSASAPPQAALPPFLDCLQAAPFPVASVVVQWPGPLRLSPAHAGGALLIKILAALEQPLARFAIYQLQSEAPAQWPPLPQPGSALLLFAERAPPDCGAVPLIHLPGLERLLAEPRSKRDAWALLRPWVPRLASANQ